MTICFWIGINLLMIGFFILSNATAFAEEGEKSLEDLLVQKGILSQEEATSVQKTGLPKWVNRVNFSGDIRIRHESFYKETAPDRHRQRFRIRIAAKMKIDDYLVGIRLASGKGEQISTNQSFDNLFSEKPLLIDRAYLSWKRGSGLILTGGKMPNPFFRVYSTDIVWDGDINPEGFAENIVFEKINNLTLFVNLGQFVLDEDSKDNNDQWMFGEQAGARITLTKKSYITLATAFYSFTNGTVGSFGQTAVQEGNTRVSSTDPTLVNPFRVLDVTGEFSTKLGRFALSIQADYVKNLANTTTNEDEGFQAGVRFGKAGKPQTWEVAYFYKTVETDATVADLADSDFGDGGTNRNGHIFWGAYQISRPMKFKIKYFKTKVENESLSPGNDDIDRLQVDFAIKF